MKNEVEERFLEHWRGILSYSKKEGPHTNILQYQQEACEQLEQLRREIISGNNSSWIPSSNVDTITTSSIEISNDLFLSLDSCGIVRSLLRLVAIDASLGSLLVSVEEEERGLFVLLRGYTVLEYVTREKGEGKLNSLGYPLPFSACTKDQFAAVIAEEEKKALSTMLGLKDIVFQISTALGASSTKDGLAETPPSGAVLKEQAPLPSTSFPYWGSSLFVLLLNGLALHATKTDAVCDLDGKDFLSVAVMLLEYAEKVYQDWDHQHSLQCDGEVPGPSGGTSWLERVQGAIKQETGELQLDSIPPESHSMYWEGFLMGDARLHTLFFLIQGLTHQGRTIEAFRCCRMTLYFQLILQNKEISRLEWSKNILSLFNHYCSGGAFGHALHCLQAAEAVITKDKDSGQEEREEALGYLYWSYGKYHQTRLQFYGDRKGQTEINGDRSESLLEKLDFSKDWSNFPLDEVPPFSEAPPITNYDEARKEFIQGLKWLNTALEYFPFDSLCTTHIRIQQDICRSYEFLCAFETNPLRVIACVQREIRILEPFAGKLNFNAYPTLQRQLLYDTGCLRERLIELCVEHRRYRSPEKNEEKNDIFTDSNFNKLIEKTIQGFLSFCQTWIREREKSEGKVNNIHIPTIENARVEEENREPFFRALMRVGRLHTMKAYTSPKEEYDGIKQACEAYKQALTFVKGNLLPRNSSVTDEELKYGEEIVNLLEVKQLDLYHAYCK